MSARASSVGAYLIQMPIIHVLWPIHVLWHLSLTSASGFP